MTAAGEGARRWPRGEGWQAWVPKIAAFALTVLAVMCALAAVGSAFTRRSEPIRVTIDYLLVPAPANLAYAVFVGVLAASVARRKHIAYWLLIGYFGLQAVGDVLFLLWRHLGSYRPELLTDDVPHIERFGTPFTVANLVLTALVLAVLVAARREFYASVQPASVAKAALTLVGLLIASTVVGYALVTASPGSLTGMRDRLTWTVERILGGAFVFDVTRYGRAPGWVNLVLGTLGALTLLATVTVLLRSQRAKASLSVDEEARIRGLLARFGERDSLGYFATRRDKSVIFSPSGKAAVTYRVVDGVSLASGDPIGDPEAWGPAIQAWLDEAMAYAWTPAVMGAGEEGATAYARAGMRVIELGDEAILDVAAFTLDGREMRPVRQAVHRVRRAGYTARIRRHAEITPQDMVRTIDLAARWRDTETERGFSMALGRLGDPADGQCVLVEALDAQGREAALLSFTPWGARGLSLDLMRRDRAADNGLVEFMVAALVAEAPRLGVERISLNFAVFRAVFEEGARIGAGPVLRVWRRLLLFFSRWWQLESLYRSNVKYRPEWVPRYLCFDDFRDLARVGLASAVAEGFLVVPSLRTLLARGAASPPELAAAGTPAQPAGAPASTLPERAPSGGEVVPAQRAAQPLPAGAALPEQVRVRLDKLAAMRAAGVDPYPPDFARTHSCEQVRAAHPDLAPGTYTGERVAVVGRVVLLRDHGALCFATVRDWTGDLQVMVTVDLDRWKSTVDLGDHVGVTGEVVASKRGELSVLADSWRITAKCLHPLPDKHRGLTDPEALVRHRHVDLIVNRRTREMLRVRAAAVHSLRTSLVERGYLEVETPILQRVHGGANARPFVTHSNAYDLRLYLRIAPELYLKRLAVGGVERVFELGRDFRNEGADATHNPEFTMLEAYQAYADYTVMRGLARDLVVTAATAAHGAPVARRGDEEYDLGGEWPVVTVHDAIASALGEPVTADTPVEELRRYADKAGVPFDPSWNRGALLLELYEHLVEARTVAPTFYTDFPTEVSPLTRAHRVDPRLAERWDLVAFGMELGTAYTELVDPVEQRRRLTEQSLLAAGGDPEAMELDEEFLQALEYAMPPTGGLGMGVDRLVMLLTGGSIRDTLPFPLVRGR